MSSAADTIVERPRLAWLSRNREIVRAIQVVLDLSALSAAFAASYLLRFEFQIPPDALANARHQFPVVIGIQLGALVLFGVYRFIWRYVGMAEIRTFVGAAAASAIPIVLLRLSLP